MTMATETRATVPDWGTWFRMRMQASAGLAWPSLLLWTLGLGPILLILTISVFHNEQAGGYSAAFELDNYRRLLDSRYLGVFAFSLWLSALVAVISVAIGFPFTWFVSQLRPRTQVLWLVFLLTGLSLSEVLIAFSWQVLLSRNIGITGILVSLGLMERKISLQPGFGALLTSLVYFVIPYTFLLFYPPISRLDRSLTEAARTMGAGPATTFFTVVVPALRTPIIGSLILVFVYVLGAYVTPTQLGKPEHWTISVYITDQATTAYNLPFGAALAVVLMVISIAMVAFTARLGREGAR